MAAFYGDYAAETEASPPDADKLSAVATAFKGHAQTIERLAGQVQQFIVRCDGPAPAPTCSGGAPKPPSLPGHFSQIAENNERLERGLMALEAAVSRLGDIG